MTSTSPPVSASSGQQQQQYCLRWNNYQTNLTNVFDQLLQSEAFVDVTLACDGHSLKAHKMVLSACSPYFQSLFFDNPCSHPIVILKDIKWEELKAVVDFMYRGEINVSQEQLAPLLKVAEVLRIRGLADVSRSGSCNSSSTTGGNTSSNNGDHEIDTNLNKMLPPRASNGGVGGLENSSFSTGGTPLTDQSYLHGFRKRRKISSDENGLLDDDYNTSPMNPIVDMINSPTDASTVVDTCTSSKTPSGTALKLGENTGMHTAALNSNSPSNRSSVSPSSSASSNTNLGTNSILANIPPALLNLHNAAAAAAAVAVASGNPNVSSQPSGVGSTNNSSGGGGSSTNVGPSTLHSASSINPNEMDLKPGIVEMIREEERAKMLESSSHGWLGGTNTNPSLSESYQYQMQNLWQKCWNQNQSGMMHALRFRERGPLKSWRPETMAEAIFAVLKEGLSLSQAARKYDIPYPTFVLYANRVHNMLGPSAESSNSDLSSDMRPKGRGRPQRILLGTWPEDHIRGVIRAVVFRDTPHQTKDDHNIPPFLFNRDGPNFCTNSPSPTTSQSHLSNTTSSPMSTLKQNGLDLLQNPQHPLFSFLNNAGKSGAAHLSEMFGHLESQMSQLSSGNSSNCRTSSGSPKSLLESLPLGLFAKNVSAPMNEQGSNDVAIDLKNSHTVINIKTEEPSLDFEDSNSRDEIGGSGNNEGQETQPGVGAQASECHDGSSTSVGRTGLQFSGRKTGGQNSKDEGGHGENEEEEEGEGDGTSVKDESRSRARCMLENSDGSQDLTKSGLNFQKACSSNVSN